MAYLLQLTEPHQEMRDEGDVCGVPGEHFEALDRKQAPSDHVAVCGVQRAALLSNTISHRAF